MILFRAKHASCPDARKYPHFAFLGVFVLRNENALILAPPFRAALNELKARRYNELARCV